MSLYNVLALENTHLLRTYSKLDRRIHQLGIMTKIWAKNCEIGNASKGSLSSYSYIIMLIHYLQRTNPPVAPFLQEVCFTFYHFRIFFPFSFPTVFITHIDEDITYFSLFKLFNSPLFGEYRMIFFQIAPPGRCREPVIIDDCDVYFCSFEDLVSFQIRIFHPFLFLFICIISCSFSFIHIFPILC